MNMNFDTQVLAKLFHRGDNVSILFRFKENVPIHFLN